MKLNSKCETTWPKNGSDAIALQNKLRTQVKLKNEIGKIRLIAGVDCSYDTKNNMSKAVVVVMDKDKLRPLETVTAELPTDFPYIPGLLSFREIPVILEAFKKLKNVPDLLMVDGQGIAHPRRLGIAAHLGVLMDIPTVGVAKSRLTGHYSEPNLKKGSQSNLLDKNERIGTVLRSKDKVAPLFISPGHKVDIDTAVKLVMSTLGKYRLPEPTRIADKISKIKEDKNRLL